jgi:hypothetical protein
VSYIGNLKINDRNAVFISIILSTVLLFIIRDELFHLFYDLTFVGFFSFFEEGSVFRSIELFMLIVYFATTLTIFMLIYHDFFYFPKTTSEASADEERGFSSSIQELRRSFDKKAENLVNEKIGKLSE